MTRAAVIEAMAEAVELVNYPGEQSTTETIVDAALDAALAAGCVLPDMMEQVGWAGRDRLKGWQYNPYPDDPAREELMIAEGWLVPVFIIRGANDA